MDWFEREVNSRQRLDIRNERSRSSSDWFAARQLHVSSTRRRDKESRGGRSKNGGGGVGVDKSQICVIQGRHPSRTTRLTSVLVVLTINKQLGSI
jgi:hypothetical protein